MQNPQIKCHYNFSPLTKSKVKWTQKIQDFANLVPAFLLFLHGKCTHFSLFSNFAILLLQVKKQGLKRKNLLIVFPARKKFKKTFDLFQTFENRKRGQHISPFFSIFVFNRPAAKQRITWRPSHDQIRFSGPKPGCLLPA